VRHPLLTLFPTVYAGERFHSARVAEPGRRAGLRSMDSSPGEAHIPLGPAYFDGRVWSIHRVLRRRAPLSAPAASNQSPREDCHQHHQEPDDDTCQNPVVVAERDRLVLQTWEILASLPIASMRSVPNDLLLPSTRTTSGASAAWTL
jgi:hypothetical protein